jgi:hypothetical protein
MLIYVFHDRGISEAVQSPKELFVNTPTTSWKIELREV